MAYPSTIDAPNTSMQGTTQLADSLADHALSHRNLGSAVINIEHTLGTTGGTNLFSSYTSNDKPLAERGGTLQKNVSGTINNSTFGTPTLRSPTLNGLGTNSGTINTGVYNNGTFGTPAVDKVKASTAGTGIYFANPIYPAVGSLTDSAGGTLTADMGTAQLYYSVMGTTAGNRTIGAPTNIGTYMQLTYAFKASGSNNGTLVWDSTFRVSQDLGTPTLGTGTTWNYYSWRRNSIDSKFDFNGQVTNII